ncbi:hypothetical protein [Thalassotalea ganghwensis]
MLKRLHFTGMIIALLVTTTYGKEAHAEEQTMPAVMSDAKVFAEYVDEKPYVVNYYTLAEEQAIIDFYQEKYGQVISQERKRGRLLVKFSEQIRIIISNQNNRQQVDLMIK